MKENCLPELLEEAVLHTDNDDNFVFFYLPDEKVIAGDVILPDEKFDDFN